MFNFFCIILALGPFFIKKDRWLKVSATISSLVVLIVGKYHTFESTYISVDEAQLLTQSKLLRQGWLPWIEWDPTTSGPLNSLWPNLLNIFTEAPTLTGGRFIALILQWGSLLALYYGLRVHRSHGIAWALTLPALYCLSLNGFPTLAGVHTGVLPGLLFTFSFYFYERSKQSESSTPYIFSLMLSGAQLMTKIQVAPAVLGFTVASFIRRSKTNFTPVIAFIVPTLLILSIVGLAGGLDDFWSSYIIGNLYYGAGVSLSVPGLLRALFQSSQFPIFLTLVIALLLSLRRESFKDPYVIQWGLLILSILPSGAFLVHYIDILLYPLIFAVSSVFTIKLKKNENFLIYLICLVSLSLGWQFVYPKQKTFTASQYTAAAIEDIIPPWRPASIAIWGWMPEVYLLTNTTPGTRDTITQFALSRNPRQDYYIRRFINDLEKNRPLWFLDVACREPKLRRNCGLENYPLLENYLKTNYSQMEFYKNPIPWTSGLWKRKKD
jgi:hypothetical protein